MNEMRDDSSRLHINTTWPPKGRARRTIIGAAAATAAAGTIMVLSAAGGSGVAGATPPAGKVTLCHATAATTNPYVVITVSTKAVQHKILGPNGHGTHVGPIFDPNGGKDQPVWGDIIPPIPSAEYPGLNWDATGISIWENGCNIPGGTSSSAPPSTPVETTPVETTPVETTPVETTPVETSAPPSHSISGSSSHRTNPSTSQSSSLGISGGRSHTTSNGPIPAGVSAGLHTPIANAGLKAWGIVLMVLGGAAGLLAGAWPTRRRAH